MNTQRVKLATEYGVNSYCALHPDQDINVTFNQREGGLIDAIIQPCEQCLADAEAFGRANQVRDEREEECSKKQ
jgi:hypothetical protein